MQCTMQIYTQVFAVFIKAMMHGSALQLPLQLQARVSQPMYAWYGIPQTRFRPHAPIPCSPAVSPPAQHIPQRTTL